MPLDRRLHGIKSTNLTLGSYGGVGSELAVKTAALDHLLAYLHVVNRDRTDMGLVAQWMEDAGYAPRDMSEAWLKARSLGYTKATGLGDVLTTSGADRGREIAEQLNL